MVSSRPIVMTAPAVPLSKNSQPINAPMPHISSIHNARPEIVLLIKKPIAATMTRIQMMNSTNSNKVSQMVFFRGEDCVFCGTGPTYRRYLLLA